MPVIRWWIELPAKEHQTRKSIPVKSSTLSFAYTQVYRKILMMKT